MPARPRVRHALALSSLLLSSVLAAGSQQHLAPSDCLEAATALEVNELLRARGEGAALVLCPYAHISIDSHGPPITFTAPRQSLYTKGFPEDHSRATLVIEHTGKHLSGDLTTAVAASCDECRGLQIRNLHVDGGREQLGGLEGGDALVVVGGAAGAQEVRHVDAWGARGYAVIHAADGKEGTCRDVVLSENVVHTAGDALFDAFLESELARLREGPPAYLGQERPGTWTDGISVSCAHSTVSDNTIRDVSGVGIAVRGAPGSRIYHNTVVARDRDMLAGISLVANPVFRHDTAALGGVTVRENRIHAASAMIRIGIATGSGAWATDELAGDHEIPFSSEILRNRLSSYSGYFGYAIALSDARGLVVQDNAISASIWGLETSACYSRPAYIPPTPLLRDPRSVIGSLQPGFTNSHFGFLLCVGPGSSSSSFEVSRHQINDQHARSFHEALSRAEGAVTQEHKKGTRGKKGRGGRGAARPAAIPLSELHPHPAGARADAAPGAAPGARRHAPPAPAPRPGRAVEAARALVARRAHAHAHQRGDARAPPRQNRASEAAAEAVAQAVEGEAPRVEAGMQRRRLRAPRPLARKARAFHGRDESVL